jgi:superfamily I DNA/RNA helicase
MSLEKARRLEQNGQDVVWMCYNKRLAESVKERFPDAGFIISHFHSFAVNYIQDAGLEVPFPNLVKDDPDSEDWSEFWSEQIPELLQDARNQNDRRYDALILDEAQDLQDDWYMPLSDLLGEGETWFYAFYDSHQSIYGDLPDWISESDSSAFPLNQNVRNSENIGESALNLGDIQESIEYGHPGQKIRLSLAADTEGIVDEVRKGLHEVFVEEELDPEQAIILERHQKENSCLAGIDSLGNFDINEDSTGGNQEIQFSTIHSYKGLEANVVFLLLPEWDTQHRQMFYTGATRAKHLLWVFTADSTVPERLPDKRIQTTSPQSVG